MVKFFTKIVSGGKWSARFLFEDQAPELDYFAEAAAVCQLGVVVTADTAVAHLAARSANPPSCCCRSRRTGAGCASACAARGIPVFGCSGRTRAKQGARGRGGRGGINRTVAELVTCWKIRLS
jgi:hypothetical protein